MPPDLNDIVACFRQRRYTLSAHAALEMSNDHITASMLELAFDGKFPETIEDYPDDPRGSSCLLLIWIDSELPVHLVVAYWRELPIVITVYHPSRDKWLDDFRTRRI